MGSWIEKRSTGAGVRYRVRFRLGRSLTPKLAGTFHRLREARARRDWVLGELAGMRVPNLEALAGPKVMPTVREMSKRWQASRKDVRSATTIQHRRR